MKHRTAWVAALVGALVLGAAPASAAPNAKDKAEAKALVTQAKTAAKQKRWGDAATALERADELDPSAQTKLDLGRALLQEKKLVAASKALNGVVDSAKGPGGKKLVGAAKKLLTEIEPRVPWIQIDVVGPSPDKAAIAIDGQDVDAKMEVPIDPGEHLVTVEADGFEPAEKKIVLAEGKHERLKITLDKMVEAEATPVASEDKAEEEDNGGSALPAILAFGVGAAGIGVGTIFGVMAFSETDKVKGSCDGTSCPPEVQQSLDVAKTNGTISTVGFVVGGVGIATGVVLLLTRSGSTKKVDGADTTAHVRPWVGPGQAGVLGKF
jgi:hypothetical protein